MTLAIAQGFRVRVASIYVQEYVLNGEITMKKRKEGGINELKRFPPFWHRAAMPE